MSARQINKPIKGEYMTGYLVYEIFPTRIQVELPLSPEFSFHLSDD